MSSKSAEKFILGGYWENWENREDWEDRED